MAAHASQQGWYPDPDDPGRQRFWSGTAWTDDVAVRSDRPRRTAEDSAKDVHDFLRWVRTSSLIDYRTFQQLDLPVDEWAAYQERRNAWVLMKRPVANIAAPGPAPTTITPTTTRPTPTAQPAHAAPPVTRQAPPERHLHAVPTTPLAAPTPVTAHVEPRHPAWGERARAAVASDVTVHGLAYAGVLLLLAGVIGFVVFAFRSLEPSLRPVAEVLLPLSLFLTGAFLGRRGATVAATALTVGGAALVPVAVITPFVDGAPIPDDITGTALAIVASVAVAAVAAIYAVIGPRRPTSPLRYLAAPVAWLAVGLATLIPDATEVVGREIAAIRPPQVAAMSMAVAITSLLARWRSDHPLARPTIVSCLVGGPVLLVLAAATAGQWQALSVVVVAVATVLALEGLADELPGKLVAVGQPVAASVAALALIEPAGLGWAGALGVAGLLGLVEWQGLRRPDPTGIAVTGAALVAASGIAFAGGPWYGLAVAVLLTTWSHARRIVVPDWLPAEVADTVAALAPVAIGVSLFRLLDPWVATVVTAAAVLAVVAGVRWRSPAGAFFRWWTTAAVLTTAVIPVAVSGQGHTAWLGVAAGLTTIAAAALLLPMAQRVWLCTALAVETAAFALTAADVAPRTQAMALAGVALALVIVGVRPGRWAGHVAAIGHVLALVAAVVVTAAPEPTLRGTEVSVVLGLMLAGWMVTVLAGNRGPVPVIELAERSLDMDDLDLVLALAAAAALPVVTLSVYDSAAGLTDRSWWAAVAVAATGWLVATSTHLFTHRRPIGLTVATVGMLTALLGAGAALAEPWPAIVASAIVAATAVSTARPWRGVWTPWIVWLAAVPIVHHGASLAGVPDDRIELVSVVWGATITIAAFAIERVRHHSPEPQWVTHPWLIPASLIGPLLITTGVMAATTRQSEEVWGSTLLIAAVAAAAIAWGGRAGSTSIVAWLLLTTGLAAVTPIDVRRESWILVAWAGMQFVASALVQPQIDQHDRWHRWDLASLGAATASAVAAVSMAAANDDIAVTWSLAGLLAFAVAVWRREWPWAVAGIVLVNGAAIEQGWWWTAASLTLTSVAAGVTADRQQGRLRWLLQAITAATAAAAAAAFTEAAGWQLETRMVVAALVGGTLALAVSVARRAGIVPDDWWITGSVLGTAGVVAGLTALDAGDRSPLGLAVTGGLVLTAAGAALSAEPTGLPLLRHASVALVTGAAVTAWWTSTPDPLWVLVAASTAAVCLTGAVMVWHRTRPTSPWLLPMVLATLTSLVLAVTAAAIDLPDTTPLAAALMVAGAVLLVLGVSLRSLLLQLGGPPALATSVTVLVADTLAGHAIWLAVPAAVAVLAMVELARSSRARLGGTGTPAPLVLVEVAAMLALAAPALVDMVVTSPWFVFAALGTGALLSGWAVITEVRRRLLVGAVDVLAALALVIGIPLVDLATSPDFGPTSGSAVFWLLIAGIGVVAIAVAVGIEQGRSQLRAARRRVLELTDGWE